MDVRIPKTHTQHTEGKQSFVPARSRPIAGEDGDHCENGAIEALEPRV
jgi:hypothetical protein